MAAFAVASGKTNAEAASAAGVSEKTICNWLNETSFQTRTRQLRSEMVSRATARLADAMVEAANVLRALLGSKDESERRHAAVKILELAMKTREIEELQHQLADLERRVAALSP